MCFVTEKHARDFAKQTDPSRISGFIDSSRKSLATFNHEENKIDIADDFFAVVEALEAEQQQKLLESFDVAAQRYSTHLTEMHTNAAA